MTTLNKLLQVLNNVTSILFLKDESSDVEHSIQKNMELIGSCLDVDRIHIFQNEVIEGVLYFVKKYTWSNNVGQKDAIPVGMKMPYSDVDKWENKFMRGTYINSPTSEFSQKDQKFLIKYSVQSLAAIPLFHNNQLWGFFSLDNCHNKNVLTDDDISALQSIGLLITNVILKSHMALDMSAHEALERFSIIWSNVESGITLVDAETREVIDINPVAARMFGADKSDIIGRRCHKFLCPADECSCPIIDKNQVVDRSERKFIRADGSSIPIIKSVAKIMLNGRLTLLESFTDLSALKDVEQKLRHMEVTEKANQAKSEFLSHMSQEMRTPMNAIIGMTAIGKSSKNINRKDYSLSKIEEASTHLLGIINGILDMSKIEAGKFELSNTEFDFEQMLQRVVNVITFRIDEKNQKFSIDIDKNIPPVLVGDDQRIAQVLTNLLVNAIKFTPAEGSISLKAFLVKEDSGIFEVQFEITDSGIGISPEQQTHLFKSFQQAEADTTRKFGGTGLGLAISKTIVDMMGGRIWINSDIGKGSTFAFTIKIIRGDSQKKESAAVKTNWKNLRILAVDNNAGITEYVKNFVESYGAYCDTASSGVDALNLLRQNGSYDIYFVDWKMHDIDGLQMAKKLKAVESDRKKAVVIMTSSIDLEDAKENVNEAGIDKVLPKPLFPSVITDTINELLGVASRNKIDETVENNTLMFLGKRMLLVEDVEINREIVISLLESTQIKIDCAKNGAEAVRMFVEADGKYDMIFMDIQMPEMDGFEATKQIRAFDIPNAKSIPIVAMTANVFREDIEKCLAAGMNSHVGKPLLIDEILNKMQAYLI